MLHVPKVTHLDYPGCDRLKIVSKDELSSLFCNTPFSWRDHQKTPFSGFAKGSRFLNMVITFILHPLSHYNTITEPHAQFLLSLLEIISINFPSHFILSLIDVYRDTATRDKLIFFSAITGIICHFLSPVSCLITSPLWVPLTLLPLDGVRLSFARGEHKPRRQLLRVIPLLPPPLLCLLRVE